MKIFHVLGLAAVLFVSQAQAADIRLYSDRDQNYFAKVIAGFQAKTGKTVEIVNGSYADLKTRFQNGETGDVLLVKSLELIADAKAEGYFQRLGDGVLNAGVPAFMQDSEGMWSAVSYRVRTIAFSPDEFSASDVPTYESLSGEGFKGRLCIRNAADYMAPFVAWAISRYGEQGARDLLTGWQANMKQYTAKDTESLDMIENATCGATLTNHYYLARKKAADERFSVELAMVNSNTGGLHTNGFGGGVLKSASNAAVANQFLEYILSAEGSGLMIADPSFEYPAVSSNKSAASITQNFGPFVASEISWSEVAGNMQKAKDLLNALNWPVK